MKYLKNLSISKLGLSIRSVNSLKKLQIDYAEQLVLFSQKKLRANLGPKSSKEILDLLSNQLFVALLENDETTNKKDFEKFEYWIDTKRKKNLSEKGLNVLKLWNSNMGYSYNDVASELNLSRQRVQQLIKIAKDLGFETNTPEENGKIRSQRRLKKNYDRYSRSILIWYKDFPIKKIAEKLGIPLNRAKEIEAQLIEEEKIKKIVTRPKKGSTLPDEIKKERWDKIIKFRERGLSYNEIASKMLLSKPLIATTIREIKNSGIEVPNSRPDSYYNNIRLSEAENQGRILFIKDKLKEGWTKKKIGEELGLDGSRVSRIISNNQNDFD